MKRLLILLGCLLLLGASPVAATTWDVTAEFSGTANPNGVWSYGYETSLGGDFNVFLYSGISGGSPYWNKDAPIVDIPIIWKNLRDAHDTVDGVKYGELCLAPGDTEYTVARWTSPGAGDITITGHFGAGDLTGIMNYYIYQNTTKFFEVLDTGSDGYFSFTRTVSPDDTIDFIAGGHWWGGNTPLDVQITGNLAVPIPGAVWLLGSGLLGLVGLRRKFRK